MKKTTRLIWLGLSTASLPTLATDKLSLSSEVEYSSGKYGGTEATDILFVPFVAKFESGPTILKLTVPYVEINGPGNVLIANAGPVPIGTITTPLMTASTQRSRASGLGDIMASVSYNAFYDAPSGLLVDIGSKIKFATASKAQGLGTGKNDFGLQADVYQSLGRATTLMATLGYTWMGKPEGSNFRNIVSTSVGLAYKLDTDTTLSAFLDVRQSVVSTHPTPRELTLYVSRSLGKHWKIQTYALTGMSEASPRKGIGATLGYSL